MWLEAEFDPQNTSTAFKDISSDGTSSVFEMSSLDTTLPQMIPWARTCGGGNLLGRVGSAAAAWLLTAGTLVLCSRRSGVHE